MGVKAKVRHIACELVPSNSIGKEMQISNLALISAAL